LRGGLLILAAWCLLPAAISPHALAGVAQQPARPAAAVPDYQDFVFLGDVRPVFFRVHIQRDGKAFQDSWNAYIKALFTFLDRDGDGVLSKEEASRAPTGPQLLQQFRSYFTYQQGPAVRFEDMDTDRDGKVTLAELASYYRRNGAGPLQLAIIQGNAGNSDALTNALFKHLDADKEGKLTREKIAKAQTLLEQLDENDDELLSPQELGPNQFGGNPYYLRQVVDQFGKVVVQPTPGTAVVFPIQADDSPRQQATRIKLAQQLLAKYDRDKNQKLTRLEIGLDRAAFKLLDANHDKHLDLAELMKFVQRPPDVDLVVRLGKSPAADRQVDVVAGGKKSGAFAPAIAKLGTAQLAVTLADAHVSVRRAFAAANLQATLKSYRQFYLNQFRAADTNKDKCIDLQEAQKSPYRYYLEPLVRFADRDGDGKVSEKELNGYLNLLDQGVGCTTSLTITNNGRGLFAILDANGDGRLSLRELRTAWSRLAPYDRGKKGYVTRSDIPLQFDVTVGAGQFGNVYATPAGGAYGMGGTVRRPSTAGPVWFRKMDRNGDGDVSPREFLGTREDFKRIDTDGDGLISAEEATAADKWFRERMAKKS
jgi:Ca2+-binding EF-hand superfamily protein